MGWESVHATCYKNHNVDRKAELDPMFNWETDKRKAEVLKSSMVGSVYYAAIKITDKDKGTEAVTAAVVLTQQHMNEYYNFTYKVMDESMWPYYYDCPKKILDLLSPTESECARAWRKACYAQLEKRKKINSFNKLAVGTVIKVVLPFATTHFETGTEIELVKAKRCNGERAKWLTKTVPAVIFPASIMRELVGVFEVIK